MTSFGKRRFAIASSLLAGTVALPAAADTDTDVLTVMVTVQEACEISGSTLDFGTYTGGQENALNGQGQISYTGCAAGTLVIDFDGGTSGDVQSRQMSGDAGGTLGYQLYRNASRTQVWGTGANALQVQLIEPGAGNIAVYGSIPGGQIAAAGNYTDTVNVTLTF